MCNINRYFIKRQCHHDLHFPPFRFFFVFVFVLFLFVCCCCCFPKGEGWGGCVEGGGGGCVWSDRGRERDGGSELF